MFGFKKSKGGEIPEEEWNFSEVLDFNVETCLRYELAREIANPESYFSSFASANSAPFTLEPWPLSPQQDKEASIEFKRQRATILVRPFGVVVQEEEIESREIFPGLYFRHLDGTFRAYPVDLLDKPWLKLDEGWKANFQNYAEQFLTGVSLLPAHELRRWDEKSRNDSEASSQTGPSQVLAIKIDWRKNDASLVEGFASWLRRERPKGISSMAPISGRQSIYDRLNALSALRLRHRYSIEDAMQRTKTVLRAPLYRNHSSWDRAQRRAVHLFTREFPGAGIPRSETRISNRKTDA